MERLTKRIADHVYYTKGQYEETIPAECNASDIRTILQRLAAYEDTGLEPEEIKDFVSRWKEAVKLAGLCKEAEIDRLRELSEADKDGRCVVLPCPFYTEVYALAQAGGEIIHGELRSTNKDYCLIVNLEGNLTSKGKTWHGVQVRKEDIFLTQEAAEKALEAQK